MNKSTVILFLACCLCVVVDATNFLGDVTVSPDLRVFSSVKVVFKTEMWDGTEPKLSISASTSVLLTDIITRGSNGEVMFKAPDRSSEVSSTSIRTIGIVSSLFPFVIAISFGSKKQTILSAALLGLVSLILAQSSNFELEVTLYFPNAFQFNVVQISLDEGSITSVSGNLATSELILSVKNGVVGLSSLSVGSVVDVSASSMVILEKLSVSSETQTSITSLEDKVFLSFISGYEQRGSFLIEFGESADFPTNCSTTATTSSAGVTSKRGHCFELITGSAMVIKAKTTVAIQFGVSEATCTEFTSFDTIPPMPNFNIDSPYPGFTKKYDSNFTFIGVAPYSQTFVVNGTAERITLHKWKGSQAAFALTFGEGYLLPFALDPSREYNISFSIKQDPSNAGQQTKAKVTLRVFKVLDFWTSDNETRRYVNGPSEPLKGSELVVESSNLAPNGITTEWASYSFVFSPPVLASRPYFAIHASYGGEGKYYYKDISFQLLEKPFEMPQLFSNEVFRAANIPCMPEGVDANPRTNCPHLQGGLKYWEDPNTWPNGQVPPAGSSVTLPPNTKVLVTSCSLSTTPYGNITIPSGSELIFADSPIVLNVATIWVRGALRLGSPTCRLNSKIKITFYGKKETTPAGGKGIVGYSSSVIELHGKQFNPTWTRLAAPAIPGSDRVFLQQMVNWEAGQKVVLTTSFTHDDYYDMNEVLTIRSIKEQVIQFKERIKYYHHAGEEYQTEIGLLSRRIQVSGDPLSEEDRFGGHLMMMGEGRVRGIETNRMGQFNVLGRYPIHFHLMGISPTSYARDNSVHDSYFRCITIHGTHEMDVSRNVAFRTHGHCFYLEDGVEENSTIKFNLAAHVAYIPPVATSGNQFMENMPATPDRILPADSAAAGFYISNMWNYVQGNAASGGWAGFALPHFKTPTGAFKDTPFVIAPKDKAALLFDGNTAHSSGYYFAIFGGCLYSGGLLYYDPLNGGVLTYNGGRTQGDNNRNAKMWVGSRVVETSLNITNFKSWLCGQGTNHWGNSVEFRNSESWDVGRGATFFGPALAADSVFGVSANPLGYPKVDQWKSPMGTQGFQFYDQWSVAILSNITFVGYKNDSRFSPANPKWATNCLSVLDNGADSLNQGISAVQDIHYEDCDDSIKVQSDNSIYRKSSNIEDWDGSVTGFAGGGIIGSWAGIWKGGSDCTYDWKWLTWKCPRKPGREVINLGIEVPNYTGNANAVAGTATLCGTDKSRKVDWTFAQKGATGLSGEGWFITFPNGGVPKSTIIYPTRVPPNAKTVLVMSYPAGTTFSIHYQNIYYENQRGNYTKVGSINQVVNTPYTYYFSGTYLYFNVKNYFYDVGIPDYTRRGVTVWGINGYTCPIFIEASCTPDMGNGFCTPPTTALPPSLNMV